MMELNTYAEMMCLLPHIFEPCEIRYQDFVLLVVQTWNFPVHAYFRYHCIVSMYHCGSGSIIKPDVELHEEHPSRET